MTCAVGSRNKKEPRKKLWIRPAILVALSLREVGGLLSTSASTIAV